MRSAPPLLALAFALALTTGIAHHDVCHYLTPSVATAATPVGTYYVVDSGSVWIYEESNGMPGLQAECWGCVPFYCETDTIFF